MGSLLPGWDERAPGVAPREFQDIQEEEEGADQGYFASLAKLKRLHAEADGPSSPIPIGRRNSASLARASAGPLSPHSARSLRHADTMASGGRGSSSSSMKPGSRPDGLHRMYSMPLTRGERVDALAGLAGTSSPSPHSLDAYKTQQQQGLLVHGADYQWWRHFDSAAMNERPDLPLAKQQQAGFIPQFDVTGQHTTAFHMDTTACEDAPPAVPAH